MDLKRLSDKKLLTETTLLVKKEKKIIAELLNYFHEIKQRRLYADFGYSSLFKFLVGHFYYSESQAQIRIQSMRLISDVPEVANDIKKGEINLGQASLMQSFFKTQAIATKN